MLASKILPFAPSLQGEPGLKEILATALDLEHDQLTRHSTAAGSRHPQDGLAGYPASPLKHPLSGARMTLSKSRSIVPSTAILQRHAQHKSSLEEVMLELYHGNISVAQADEMAGRLWGPDASVALISEHTPRITKRIQSWLRREIAEPQVYVFLHTQDVKQKIGGEKRITSLFAAIGIRRDGIREILGVMAGAANEVWPGLMVNLKQRGLHGTKLFIGENDLAAHAAVRTHYPSALYQGNLIRLERDVLLRVGPAEMLPVMAAFEVMRASTTPKQAAAELAAMTARLARCGAPDAANTLSNAAAFQFNYYHFPESHWPRLHDSEPMRKILREFREWIRVIGPVPDDRVLALMAAARLRSTARLVWARRRYLRI